MRKAFRHTGVLMMIAVVALGLVGAAYALWFEDLQLTANVSTGTLNADLSIHDLDTVSPDAATNTGLPVVALPPGPALLSGGVATYLDPAPDTPLRNFINGASGYGNFTNVNFPLGKPQPSCTGALSTDPLLAANDAGSSNSLTLNMGGLYPYAGCEYEIDITNVGSVPIHFAVTSLKFFKCTGVNTGCVLDDGGTAPWSLGLDPGQPNLPQCAAWLGNTFGKVITGVGFTQVHGFNGGTGYTGGIQINTNVTSPNPGSVAISNDTATTPVQLHQTESLTCRFKLILDENPGAEGQFYQFQATYKAYQWNEAPF